MRPAHGVYAVLVALIWGGNYVASKIGMQAFPPFFYTALRFALVALVLLPFVKPPPLPAMWRLAQVALVLCVGHMGLILVAIHQGLSVGGAAVVVQMGVPFSCLLGVFLLNDRMGKWRILGMFLAFAGIIIVADSPNVVEHPWAFVIALLSALFWAVSNIQIKKLGEVDVFPLLAWKALFATPMLLAVSYAVEGPQWQQLSAAPLASWVGLAYTAFFSTIVAFGLWSWLLRLHPVSLVAPFSLLVPVAGVAAGQLFFAEALSPELLVGGALTLVGVGVITLRRPRLQAFPERS